jgi:hypothetical protein
MKNLKAVFLMALFLMISVNLGAENRNKGSTDFMSIVSENDLPGMTQTQVVLDLMNISPCLIAMAYENNRAGYQIMGFGDLNAKGSVALGDDEVVMVLELENYLERAFVVGRGPIMVMKRPLTNNTLVFRSTTTGSNSKLFKKQDSPTSSYMIQAKIA